MRHEALHLASTFSLALLATGCERPGSSDPKPPDVASAMPAPVTLEPGAGARIVPVTASAPALPAPSHSYTGRSWSHCAEGFRTSGEPDKDLTRLTFLCGPYHGMQRYPKRWSDTVAPNRATPPHDLALQRDDCIRVFSVADRNDIPFTVTVSVRSQAVGRAVGRGGYAIVNPDGAICTASGGEAKIEIQADSQPLRVLSEVWLLR